MLSSSIAMDDQHDEMPLPHVSVDTDQQLDADLPMASSSGAQADLSIDELALSAVAGQPEQVFVRDRQQCGHGDKAS